MEENELEEGHLEKTLASGEVITLCSAKHGFDVDCWDEAGNNRWNRPFSDYDKAKAEYDRWN